MHAVSVTPQLVLSISMETASTALALTMAFLMNLLHLVGKMIDSHGKLTDSHGKLTDNVGSLIGVVRDVARGSIDTREDDETLA